LNLGGGGRSGVYALLTGSGRRVADLSLESWEHTEGGSGLEGWGGYRERGEVRGGVGGVPGVFFA